MGDVAATPRDGATRTQHHPVHPRRLSASIWVPWLVGLVALLLIATATILLVGRVPGEGGVSSAVLQQQTRTAVAAADGARRAGNEAVTDLEAIGAVLATGPAVNPEQVLGQLTSATSRWRSLVIIDRDTRAVVASSGQSGVLDVIGDRIPREAGIRSNVVDGAARVVAFAPLARPNEPPLVLAGEIVPESLGRSLELAAPGMGWLLTAEHVAVTDLAAIDEDEPQPLSAPASESVDRPQFNRPGSRVAGGSSSRAEVVSWAPVAGAGPAGTLDWSVIMERNQSDLTAGSESARRVGIGMGLALAAITLALYSWTYRRLIRPILDLEEDSERVAFGDLAAPLPQYRQDEIGQIATAVERLRHRLVSRDQTPPEGR